MFMLSEGAWALCSLQTWEDCLGGLCPVYTVYRKRTLCEQAFPFTNHCEFCSDLSAVDSSPFSIKVCNEVMIVEKFQIVMASLTHLYFFILNCVCGNVYM